MLDASLPPSSATETTTECRCETASISTESSQPPPYTVAIVFLISVNVVVQIIIQAILFTGLQLSMYAASSTLTLMFVAVVTVYAVLILSGPLVRETVTGLVTMKWKIRNMCGYFTTANAGNDD